MGMFLITDNFIAVIGYSGGGGGGGDVERGTPHGAHPHTPRRPVDQGEDHVPQTEYDGEVEMVDPGWSGADEDVYQEGERVEAVEEEVEELRPGPLHHVIFHHKGVEGNPVDQRDEQRHGGGHALQGPGHSATLHFRKKKFTKMENCENILSSVDLLVNGG